MVTLGSDAGSWPGLMLALGRACPLKCLHPGSPHGPCFCWETLLPEDPIFLNGPGPQTGIDGQHEDVCIRRHSRTGKLRDVSALSLGGGPEESGSGGNLPSPCPSLLPSQN